MGLSHLLDPRRSFAAKLATAVLGTVGLLLVVMLVVVQAETRGQVELVAEDAVARARQAFEESERMRREQLSRRARVFTDNRRTIALLEAAIEAGDTAFLASQIGYALQLTRFDSTSLTVLTDAAGDPLLTFMGGIPVAGEDPAAISPLARELLGRGAPELTAYRLVGSRLYTMRVVVLEMAGRVVGSTAFGQPIRDEDAVALGRLVGAEVCFVAGDRCVAGTPGGRSELAAPLAALEAGARTVGRRQDGDRWELLSEPLTPDGPDDWRIAMAVPLEAVLSPFDRIRRALALGALGALALALLVGALAARGLARPIATLVAATGRVARGEYDTRVPESSRDEVGQLARAFNAMTAGLALKEQYRGVLDKVVSREVAEELLRGELSLGGENREVTVLFADIRGFTQLTEGMAPQAVIGLLNEIMARLSNAVDAAGGVVDKFVGDEIMAVFGAPLVQDDHATRAAGAALAMQEAMTALSAKRADRGEAAVSLGVGLHTGEAVAGNMGSPSRLNYTVVGESVNLASRLCAAAAPGEILISGATRERIDESAFRTRACGVRSFKGFSRAVDIFELVPDSRRSLDAGRARPGRGGGVAMTGVALAALTGVAGLGAAPTGAAGQSAPTLRGLGLEWISEDGAIQVGASGRMDIEGYVPGDAPPWIIPETDPFLAGRARVFVDLIAGRYVYSSVELRVDRGEEPRAGALDARIDQAFVRLGPAGPLSLQLGKFVSPFGGWPQRHHTTRDPFIRPPLMYDHRTMVTPDVDPPNTAAFVAWKDDIPRDFRPDGAPAVWGAPYQWGGMLLGGRGPVTFRLAAMNSAPSSEPAVWSWDSQRLRRPSWIVNLGVRMSPELRLGGSYNRGPYLEPLSQGARDPGFRLGDYVQELFALEAEFALGAITMRSEAMADRWEVPNVPEDVWDLSYYLEGEYVVLAGVHVAARWGEMRFNELGSGNALGPTTDSGYRAADARWDYDARRLQLAGGYRVFRNVGLQAEYAFNRTDDPGGDAVGDLFSVQLWWQY